MLLSVNWKQQCDPGNSLINMYTCANSIMTMSWHYYYHAGRWKYSTGNVLCIFAVLPCSGSQFLLQSTTTQCLQQIHWETYSVRVNSATWSVKFSVSSCASSNLNHNFRASQHEDFHQSLVAYDSQSAQSILDQVEWTDEASSMMETLLNTEFVATCVHRSVSSD